MKDMLFVASQQNNQGVLFEFLIANFANRPIIDVIGFLCIISVPGTIVLVDIQFSHFSLLQLLIQTLLVAEVFLAKKVWEYQIE